jgi:hypothetical protein
LRSGWAGPTPAALKDALIRSARQIQGIGWNARRGHGILDAEAAAIALAKP